MRPDLTIFCGKGGVGKTTLALAHGIQAAEAGRQVLLVTSHPLPELAVSVSLAGLEVRSPDVDRGLFIVHIDPYQVLKSILRSRLPSRIVADRILSSSIYRTFVEVVPGLREFAFLTRLKELAERRRRDGGEAYELLVWDAPATGHFLQILKVAANFDEYFTGPLAGEARSIQSFLLSADLEINPVVLLEEMSVDETGELVSELERIGFRPTRLFCNLVTPLLRGGRKSARLPGSRKSSPFLEFLEDRYRTEVTQLKRVTALTGLEAFPVPRLRRDGSDVEFLFALAGELPAFQGEEPRRGGGRAAKR